MGVSFTSSTRRRVAALVAVASGLFGAVAPSPAEASYRATWHDLELCAGIRGNGNRIFAHFGSVARLVEYYGPIRCAAGGSSGSITTFFIESVNMHPGINECGRRHWRCPDKKVRDRHALAYKSMAGLTDVGIGEDVQTVAALIGAIQAADIETLLETDPLAAVEAFQNVLADFGAIINPEVFELLAQSPDPVFHVQDLIAGLQDAAGFQVADSNVFIRTGVINFDVLVDIFGRVGDFYAGVGPADIDGVDAWMDECAAPSRNLTWAEASLLPMAAGDTCGERFASLYRTFETAHRDDPPAPSRLDDSIGNDHPMLAVTGVLTGDAIDEWEVARERYFAAEPPEFAPNFDDVKFGYFGNAKDLQQIDRKLDRLHPGDAVTERFFSLGAATWREILGSSPNEPGFNAAVPLSSGVLSVGGWADPLRVQVLDALGGRHVVTVNRRGGEQLGGFTPEVTRQLGASDADLVDLYSLADPDSSFVNALETADAVWCSDWDAPDGFDVPALFFDGYNAPMLTSDRFFLRKKVRYPGASPDISIAGCTPGVT